MARKRPTLPTRISNLAVQITDDGSRTFLRTDTGDGYHSASGAAAETRHVYLDGSGVQSRLTARQPTRVLELGLGTGMAMLLTVDWAIQCSAPLEYVALEHEWLPADVLAPLQLQDLLAEPGLFDRYSEFRAALPDTVSAASHHWQVDADRKVTVIAKDIRHHNFDAEDRFDAIYFDPFAPSTNHEVWHVDVMKRLCHVLSKEGRLVTYCVKRAVRDALAQVGFDVHRVPGPVGGKREVLVATIST